MHWTVTREVRRKSLSHCPLPQTTQISSHTYGDGSHSSFYLLRTWVCKPPTRVAFLSSASVLPRQRVSAFLILHRLVRLPQAVHLSAFQAAVTHPVTTTANGIDVEPLGVRHTCLGSAIVLARRIRPTDPFFCTGGDISETYNPDLH